MDKLKQEYEQVIQQTQNTKKSVWGMGSSAPTEKTDLTMQIVDLVLKHAVIARASDVHFEPLTQHTRIRFRIDGQLHTVLLVDNRPDIFISARIKIMAGLPTDAMMQRKSQDGRFRVKMGASNLDFRISTFPTVEGEKIVLRIFNENAALYSIDKIGLNPRDEDCIRRLMQQRSGLLLVSGPTGSGKTTTLYAMLKHLHSDEMNIVTLEDPVEYRIEGINQCDIRKKSDFNFADGLKAVLRQDPDIVLVGEMRDVETAEIALRASITGHLVLSTLHSNSAIGTVARLINMGLDPYMVSYAIIGAIAQRLVRTICLSCREEKVVSSSELQKMGIDPKLFLKDEHKTVSSTGIQYSISEPVDISTITLYQGRGCPECNQTGYKGRIGIYEIVSFSEKLREGILNQTSASDLEKIAIASGMTPLSSDAVDKVKKGITTVEEIVPLLLES